MKKKNHHPETAGSALAAAQIITSGQTAVCPIHGMYAEKKLGKHIFGCPECRAIKHHRADQTAIAQILNERLKQLWLSSGVPKRYREKRLSDFLIDAAEETDRQKQALVLSIACRYVDEWESNRRCGKSLVFLGRPGTGKTHLAVGISHSILERYGASVRYVSLIDVIEQIKDSWNGRSSESTNELIQKLTETQLLILDEASVRHGTQNEQLQVFRIINKRYENMYPTILISNTDARETERLLGAAAWDRLKEGRGQVVIFDWPSHRCRSMRG